jgi:hypothetical protein
MILWQDMSDEEKGALLLAYYNGKEIEYNSNTDGAKWSRTFCPMWCSYYAYRVKPEPVVEVKTLFGGYDRGYNMSNFYDTRYPDNSHKITFNVVDGEPDVTSIKMEKL